VVSVPNCPKGKHWFMKFTLQSAALCTSHNVVSPSIHPLYLVPHAYALLSIPVARRAPVEAKNPQL